MCNSLSVGITGFELNASQRKCTTNISYQLHKSWENVHFFFPSPSWDAVSLKTSLCLNAELGHLAASLSLAWGRCCPEPKPAPLPTALTHTGENCTSELLEMETSHTSLPMGFPTAPLLLSVNDMDVFSLNLSCYSVSHCLQRINFDNKRIKLSPKVLSLIMSRFFSPFCLGIWGKIFLLSLENKNCTWLFLNAGNV